MNMRDVDKAIRGGLASLDANQREELAAIAAAIRTQDGEYGEWKGGAEVRPGVIHAPYVQYTGIVQRMLSALNRLIVPFAWPEWHEGTEILRAPSTDSFRNVSPIDAVKLLTVIVRADRFDEGLLLEKLDDRTVGALIGQVVSGITPPDKPSGR